MTKHFTHSLCTSLIVVLLLTVINLTAYSQDIPEDAASITAGATLFSGNCKSCHKIHAESVGPALAGVYDRAPSIQWIKDWVHNSAKVVASKDEYAVAIFEKYKKSQMTAFTTLKDEEIMQILAYIKAETIKGPEVAAVPTTPGSGTTGGEGLPSTYMNVILIGMVLILVLLVVILGFLVSSLKRFLDQKELSDEEKEVVHSPITLATITRSSGFIFVVMFVVGSLGFKAVINGLYSVGVQQGYAPKQPIAFSHKLHAGDYEIDCKYCHIGTLKGKSATIPSVNICMNCHRAVKTESPQIQKIWAAADWNAETLTFGPNQKPIEWVRIHNLPDLAYFNHSQHVVVGGIECQTCHGPIETMDVVKQYSLLTMGWCIDCHRKTDIKADGNAYYDKLQELHEQAKGSNSKMKVEDIGGLECAKCHY
ncbi:MAG TPA: c-type cytochrome [Cyclobacteriaceae bacterium]|nr:c-type cytochrome [Cyclobacteriaceae bacterium]